MGMIMRLSIERREPVLGGRPFGLAGAYETLVGTVEFALDPNHPRNQAVVDLGLATRNAQGEVVFSADFYLIKPKQISGRRSNAQRAEGIQARASTITHDDANSHEPALLKNS